MQAKTDLVTSCCPRAYIQAMSCDALKTSDAFNPDGDNATITRVLLSFNGGTHPVDSASLGVSPCWLRGMLSNSPVVAAVVTHHSAA